MNVLVRKMSSLKLLKVELIFGTIFSAIAMIGIPVSIFCIAPDLLKEPLAWGIALGIMLFFGLVGYGLFVRPYRLYLKFPFSIDENYELNDSGCYRTHRLEENLYEDYLLKDYNREDVITYQWNQNRKYNLKDSLIFIIPFQRTLSAAEVCSCI